MHQKRTTAGGSAKECSHELTSRRSASLREVGKGAIPLSTREARNFSRLPLIQFAELGNKGYRHYLTGCDRHVASGGHADPRMPAFCWRNVDSPPQLPRKDLIYR